MSLQGIKLRYRDLDFKFEDVIDILRTLPWAQY
jgi:hypothetical protein